MAAKIAACGVLMALLCTTPGFGAVSSVTVGVRNNILASLVVPDGPGPFPGVLVLEPSYGLSQVEAAFARRLAGEGYVCLVPGYMEAYNLIGSHYGDAFTTYSASIYADLVQAADVLRRHEKVGGSKVGAVGFSNGGFFAVFLAVTRKIQAGVSYYGAFEGPGRAGRFQGTVTAQSSPALFLIGALDRTVPVNSALRVVRLFQEANAPHEAHIYQDAGHTFDRHARFGPYVATAAEDAWQRTVTFLDKYLKQQ